MPKLWKQTIASHRTEVREAIIETTGSLVGSLGLRAVTMLQIAKEAGIGRATLYKYFPDVEAILRAWHERHVFAHLTELAAMSHAPGDPMKRLHAVLEAFAALQHRRHAADLVALLHRGAAMDDAKRKLVAMLERLLTEGAKKGEVRRDAAPAELATYCLHALTAASQLRTKAAVRRLVEMTIAGVQPPR